MPGVNQCFPGKAVRIMNLKNKDIDFSMRIGELVRYLRETGQGFPLCDRLLFCGVNAGMCIRSGKTSEAAEFIEEADYIIEMAVVAGYLTTHQDVHIRADCNNLLKMLNGGESQAGATTWVIDGDNYVENAHSVRKPAGFTADSSRNAKSRDNYEG